MAKKKVKINKRKRKTRVQNRKRGVRKPQSPAKKKRTRPIKGYGVNKDFPLFSELQALVLKASPIETPVVKRDLKRIGKIKLALMSGAFLGVDEARVDLLVVGENISLSKLFEFIKQKESELGQELRYVILSPDEFTYRYEMFDRFLKDILETPHQKVINSIRVS